MPGLPKHLRVMGYLYVTAAMSALGGNGERVIDPLCCFRIGVPWGELHVVSSKPYSYT
ncbi:hypothetical protein XBKB1_3770008 [Xenorhabdus bovienii str. kraussei Becker Underwood]|uniref:Uncharacterized protein n=1 Tax=Xenorhabdus bovienii str. kraussei Becker Underwood TaxID=1398204 RepID=A0A077PWT7_XENBV|nr:hypothetical protein XBKB1_3770008 [Xenorhabdus bovienii str. kraussei Becker Underwood]